MTRQRMQEAPADGQAPGMLQATDFPRRTRVTADVTDCVAVPAKQEAVAIRSSSSGCTVRPVGRERRVIAEQWRVIAEQQGQDFAHGALPAGGFGQRQVGLDFVPIAAAVLLLDDVAGLG